MPQTLSPRYVRRRLGRPLVGQAEPPTDEYLLLQLLNTGQIDQLQERLAASPPANPRRADLISLLKAQLAQGEPRERPPQSAIVQIPAAVWDRYAQRAREQHIRIRSALADAILRDDDRLQRAQARVQDVERRFGEDVRVLTQALADLSARVPTPDGRPEGPEPSTRGRLEAIDTAVGELRANAANHTVALAAILAGLERSLPKHIVGALREQGWLRK